MASGGARARSGPPPDPNALRRDRQSDADGWLTLPAEGRTDPAPNWPMPSAASDAELAFWAKLWAKPEALEWERLGLDDEVALYVRRHLEATERDSPANLSNLVKQLAENLGLTVPGLLRLRWKIGELASAGGAVASSGSSSSVRSRLRVVADDAPGA